MDGLFGKVIHVSQLSTLDSDLSVNSVGILVDSGSKIDDTVTLNWKEKKFRVWVTEELDDWIPDCLFEDNGAEEANGGDGWSPENSNGQSCSPLEHETSKAHGDTAEDIMGSNDSGVQGNSEFQGFGNNNNNKGNSSSVSRGIRKNSFNLLMNKHKNKPSSTSPGSDNRPKKRTRSESDDIFNLNGLLGLGNNRKHHADLKNKDNGEIRKKEHGGFDLNSRADSSNVYEPGNSGRQQTVAGDAGTEVGLNPLFSGVGIQEEIQATVLLGNKLGADLGGFNTEMEKIITNEGNNVVFK
ncbi:hypothetical protein L1987_47009 [Smallanthus sonchifolius]|uniref:Uncharacterized protein n=1 Tax=Smallanthus sonchifolius TaxID=185202 RepID=A0ACB9G168_9ASTR|nr:hypothetical protein L1987_47009 [Smallanthus sonchifolius]